MYYIDENLTKTKAFKEQMDQHAEILFGDGNEVQSNLKRSQAEPGKIRQAFSKLFQPLTQAFHRRNIPTVK